MPNAVGTTHHVKIGSAFSMLSPGGYRRRPAPIFGARVSSGDPDYTNLGVYQHWVQNCWIGGLGADEWTDEAMYASGVGVDTTNHEFLSLSRDLGRPTGVGSLNSMNGGVEVRRFCIFDGVLFCVTCPAGATDTSRLYKYTRSTQTWSLAQTFTSYRVQFIGVAYGNLVVGGGTVGGTSKYKISSNPGAGSPTWTDKTSPAAASGNTATAMGFFQRKLYMAFANRIVRIKNDWTQDGSAVYYDAPSEQVINNFRNHLGFMYFSSRDGHIYRTDGDGGTFDIWSWDGFTIVTSLASYDGKLFIACYEYSDTTDYGQGSLYQLTGSAVTQLKKWGEFDSATTLGRMVVYDRKLFYGAAALWNMNKDDTTPFTDRGGFGVAVYDCVEDAHSIWATNKDSLAGGSYPGGTGGINWIVDDVAFYQGYLHISVRGYGVFQSPLSYRDYLRQRAKYDTTSTAVTGVSSQGFLVSSEYDGGTPGLLKHWSKITVNCELQTTSHVVAVQYSTNNGQSWVRAGVVKKELSGTVGLTNGSPNVVGTGTNFSYEVSVGDVLTINGNNYTVDSITDTRHLVLTTNAPGTSSGHTATHTRTRFNRSIPINVFSPRLSYRLELRTGADTGSPIVYGIAVSYLPRPDPNWMWELLIPVVDKVELLNNTLASPSVEELDTNARLAYFRSLFRSQRPFVFTDLDGTTWADDGTTGGVIMWDYMEDLHVPGNSTDDREVLVRMVLLEVVENYTVSTS